MRRDQPGRLREVVHEIPASWAPAKAFSDLRLHILFGLRVMSKRRRLNSILDKAKGKEKRYEWPGAAELYAQALSVMVKADFLRKGEIQQRIGYCFYRAGFQAKIQKEFERSMRLSAKAYEDGVMYFDRLEDSKKQARVNFCRAMSSYSRSWLAEDSSERKALLDECRKLQKETLKTYEKTGDEVAFGEACNELLTCLFDRFWLMQDWQEGMNILEEGTEYGEKAIEALSLAEGRNENQLARTYALCSVHYYWLSVMCEPIEKQQEIRQKCLTNAQKALESSEDAYVIALSNWASAWGSIITAGDLDSGSRHAEEMLKLGTTLKDSFILSLANATLAYLSFWKMQMEDDPDKRRDGFRRAIQYGRDSTTRSRLISSLIPSGFMAHIDSHSSMALDAVNLEERRVLLEKAVEVGREHLEGIRRWYSPITMGYMLHPLSKALLYLSTLETKKNEKRRLLEEASKHREETINLFTQATPFDYWNQGVMYNYSALIKAELAKMEMNRQKKEEFLRKAVADMEDCMKLCTKAVKRTPQQRLFAVVGEYQDQFGGILHQLYSVTGEKRNLERAIAVYADSVRAWEKSDLHSRIAETHWKMAKLNDLLGEHSKAAHEFKSAAEEFTLAAEKIPQLKTFYTDHAVYMQAWEEIERARHHHGRQEYELAKEHFEKAANLHKSSKQWSYLASNYGAWAQVENAEELSRREQSEEALKAFKQAAKLFAETKESLQTQLSKIDSLDEKRMATSIAEATDHRHKYCIARITLEEAKVLDKKGDHFSSSEKYGAAAEAFQKIDQTLESMRDRKELTLITTLSRAWQMMTRAEAEASPNLYKEASRLFDEAKDHSLDEKAKMLALGHSRFCRALEAGTRFEDVRDTPLHTLATRHLESAASYYLKAGFGNASEYAEATQKLLDAYLHMHNAKTETDPAKKARFYMMAEKVLQASAGSYLKAKHPEKQEQVARLLEKVRKERELALSLNEVLHAPLATSTTETFTTPTPTEEAPVGLERFEHADIQANLILRVKEVKVGEDVSLEIELINTGKAPALLIKVEKAIPEGFEFKTVPETYRAEDSFLDLKGKRLNPLKTEEVKMVIQPLSKGTFTMKPRIRYLDENGQYKSHEPEPVTITVKELGIGGWIRGER